MHLLLVGVSHHTAPVELRERVAFTAASLPAALAQLGAQLPHAEAVVLSTCNRAEIYTTCEDPESARGSVADFLAGFHGLPSSTLRRHLYTCPDEEAARHLFRVAAGLDSLVVGEPQILGQVKDAYAVATEQHTTGATLNKLFHWAFAVGKRVRAETGLGEGAVSVGYAAVSLARKIFGDLRGLDVLVLGAGEMARLTAQHLLAHDVGAVTVSSRTIAHAHALAGDLGVEPRVKVAPWDEAREDGLLHADVLVTATGSTTPILGRAQVESALRHRRTRPLFVIDIAVPRDVDATVGDLDEVFLYNLDDLQTVITDNLARRTAQLARAEAIVEEEVTRFVAWLRGRDAVPTLIALRERFEAIRQAELDRLSPKLAALGPDARARVDEVTRLIVQKLLINPTEQLKSLSDRQLVQAYSDALTRLFGLDGREAVDPKRSEERGETREYGRSG